MSYFTLQKQTIAEYGLPLSAGVLIIQSMLLIGFMAEFLLGIDLMTSPFDVFYILKAGFLKEVLLSALIILSIISSVFAFYKGGIARVIFYYALYATAFISVGVFFGLLVFGYWMGYNFHGLADYLLTHCLTHADKKNLAISLFAGFFIPSFFIYPLFRDKFSSEAKALGDAHFASGLEVARSGFLKKEDGAILIGKKYDTPLWSNGFEHVLVFASTGSGKTRSISIPNLFQYPYSVVCNDVKLSLYETTSGYREKVLGHKCYCFSPTAKKTHRFNPLTYISDDKNTRMTDIQRIAHILMPENKKDPLWSQASRKLFKTVVLYLLDTPGSLASLGEINRLVKQAKFDDWLSNLLDTTEHYDPEFYRNGYSYINNHYKTRSCILETFTGYFELFDDPIIDNATSHTDFDIRNLRKEKMTIYIGFSDDDMERLSPLLTLFWQQLMSSMIQKLPDLKEEPYPVLCLIDEFSSLGRIERLRRSLKLLREYRVRCVLMVQYIAQTFEQYSKDEAKAFTNIKTKIAYSTDDFSDAEYISKILGVRTKRVNSGSVSYQTQGMSDSKNYNYQAIPLMRPDKITKLSTTVALIMRTGYAPLKARQFIWFKESSMKHLKQCPVCVPEHDICVYAFDHSQKKKKKDVDDEAADFI